MNAADKLSRKDLFLQSLLGLPEADQDRILGGLSEFEKWELENKWENIARPNQLPPSGDWRIWLICAGRGWGKSRSVCEYVTNRALAEKCLIAVYSRTAKDLSENIFQGDSGLVQIAENRKLEIDYNQNKSILTYPNGSQVYGYSAETVDAIRGKNLSLLVFDELGTYQYAEEIWDNAQLALRKKSEHPTRTVIATTPNSKSNQLMRRIIANPKTVVVGGSSWENIDNLSENFADTLRDYEGTRYGRQEIYAELLDDSGVLFKASFFDRREPIDLERLERIVVAFDPATGSMTADAGEHGIVIAGRLGDVGYILDDWSIKATPEKAARRVIEAFNHYRADRVIIERNQGGDWIPTVIKSIDPFVAVTMVHAMVGKRLRAEPVSAMYEQGRVIHCRYMKELEDQMIAFDPDRPRPKNKSPDRLDALVWAITGLFEKKTVEPKSFNFTHSIF